MNFKFILKIAAILLLTQQKIRLRAALILRRNEQHAARQSWHTVVRQAGFAGDAILATHNTHEDCEQRFGALAWSSEANAAHSQAEHDDIGATRRGRQISAACVCAPDAPTFRHDVGKCVAKIAECSNPISFRETLAPRLASRSAKIARDVPGISLPFPTVSNGAKASDAAVVGDDFTILWKDSAVKVWQGLGARCTLSSAKYLNREGIWKGIEVTEWFRLGWTSTAKASIFWSLSSKSNATLVRMSDELAGVILVVGLRCGTSASTPITPTITTLDRGGNPAADTHCLSFRVEGEIVNEASAEKSSSVNTVSSDGAERNISILGILPAIIENFASTSLNETNDAAAVEAAANRTTLLDAVTQSPPHPQSQQQQGRLETMLIILLAILLFLSIFGSLILWNICWRIKKSELISTLQMQFLYHIKQEKEKAACAAAVNAHNRFRLMTANNTTVAGKAANKNELQSFSQQQLNGSASHSFEYGSNINGGELGDDFQQAIFGYQPAGVASFGVASNSGGGGGIVKRKLYFSAEFFEPFFMANPPPMAEQFLQDLRRMIVVAKQRIAQRKHVPQLAAISEEDECSAVKSATAPITLNGNNKQLKTTVHAAKTKANAQLHLAAKPKEYLSNGLSTSSTESGRDHRPLGKRSLSAVEDDASKTLALELLNGSPKSAKSASDDSGHDTFRDASSSISSSSMSSSEEAEECSSTSSVESASPALTPPLAQRARTSQAHVSPLKQQHFIPYSGLAIPTTRQNPCYQPQTYQNGGASPSNSRIPVSKSPRLQPKPFLTTAALINDFESSPNHHYHQVSANNHLEARKNSSGDFKQAKPFISAAVHGHAADANLLIGSSSARSHLPPPPMPPPLPTSAPPAAPPSSKTMSASYDMRQSAPAPKTPRQIELNQQAQSNGSSLSAQLLHPQSASGTAAVNQRQTPTTLKHAAAGAAHGGRNHTIISKRNAYAVFPSDSMLKKSLPRRSKKATASSGMKANGYSESHAAALSENGARSAQIGGNRIINETKI